MLSTPIYIISYFLNLSQIGSSANLPAHWEGGARARINQVFAKKFASPSEGEAEGGGGGNSASPERIQKADSPAVLLVKSRTPQNSFLFLLEEKNRRAQIKKCEENFLAGWRASASGGGAERQISQSGFSSKKVRILSKRYRQFSEFGFW